MGRKRHGRPTGLLQGLVEIGTDALTDQLGIPREQARVAMREVAFLFAQQYGGEHRYVNLYRDYELESRDLELYDRMDRGASTSDVACFYEITPRQVQIIMKHVRENGAAAARQGELPGFDAP